MISFDENPTPTYGLDGIDFTSSRSKKRARKPKGALEGQATAFSFTVNISPTTPQSGAPSGKEEDKLIYDWSVLRKWANEEKDLPATSQARVLFDAEKKDRMTVEEATAKFVVIFRVLDDELKRRGF